MISRLQAAALIGAGLLIGCAETPAPLGPLDAASQQDRRRKDGKQQPTPDKARQDKAHPRDKGVPPGPDKNQNKGKLLPQKMKITYYYLAQEKDYAAGPPNAVIKDSACKAIATVSKKFYDALCIEGSGRLKDGRVVNYWTKCTCADQCAYGSKICYKALDAKKYPWGLGAASNALSPLRSWAVDKSIIPLGTLLYAPAWDGVKLPAMDGLGGWTHDGCFRADDVGGGVKGYHYDFFSGTRAMYKALEKLGTQYHTHQTFTVYRDAGRCAHLNK